VECHGGGDGGGGGDGDNNRPILIDLKACTDILAKQKSSTSAIYILES